MFNFWWSAKWYEQKMLTKMQKNEKGPLSHWKIKCSFLDYVQLLMISQAIWAKNVGKNKKGPLSHWKIKCSFLEYIQLLMIGWAIWAKNVDQNTKKKTKQKRPPKTSKNNVHFWITFNSWWLAEWSEQKTSTKTQKKQKRPPKSSKNKMFIFGLCSTSDDRPSGLSKKCWPKHKKAKKAP